MIDSTVFKKTPQASSGLIPAHSRLAVGHPEPARQVQTESPLEVGRLQQPTLVLFSGITSSRKPPWLIYVSIAPYADLHKCFYHTGAQKYLLHVSTTRPKLDLSHVGVPSTQHMVPGSEGVAILGGILEQNEGWSRTSRRYP